MNPSPKTVQGQVYFELYTQYCWGLKPDTQSVTRAFEGTYNLEQVLNALRRLRRARRVEYMGARGAGWWKPISKNK